MSYERIGEGILKWLLVASVLALLGIWKLVEIAVWLWNHVEIRLK